MPDLSTTLHTDMLRHAKRSRRLAHRIAGAIRMTRKTYVYGTEWGVIDDVPPLTHVLDRWVRPYVKPNHVAVEIGPGGGRWSQHLLGFSKLYLVDYYEDLLAEVRRNFGNRKNIEFIKNNGNDFPNIPDASVYFCFSFGVFVHLDQPIIAAYLQSLKRIMKKGANIVMHYSDMNKIMAQMNDGFSRNTPEEMRRLVLEHGYTILEEDTTSLWHSSLVRFALPSEAGESGT